MKAFKLWISIVLTVIMFSSCGALKTPVIVRNAPIEGYRYVFITPTKELTSSAGGTYGGQALMEDNMVYMELQRLKVLTQVMLFLVNL